MAAVCGDAVQAGLWDDDQAENKPRSAWREIALAVEILRSVRGIPGKRKPGLLAAKVLSHVSAGTPDAPSLPADG